MNISITVSTSDNYLTIISQDIIKQLKESFLISDENNSIDSVQVFNKNKLNILKELNVSTKTQIQEKKQLIEFFNLLDNEEIFTYAKIFIDCKENKAIHYLSVFVDMIKKGKSKDFAMKIANNAITECFNISKYFNQACDFSTMFNKSGYNYVTYVSRRFTYDTLDKMAYFEEFIEDELYLKYEKVKYEALELDIANWDFCIVLHAIDKEQKKILIEFERILFNA